MLGRPIATAGALLGVGALGLVLAVGAFGTPVLPTGWSHISVNVVRRGVPYTLVYDRGTVTAVTANSLTLRESGGTIWVIDVAPTAQITISGQPASLAQVQPKEFATTLAINGAAASVVKVVVPRGVKTSSAPTTGSTVTAQMTTTTSSTATTSTAVTTTTPKNTTTTPKKPTKPKLKSRLKSGLDERTTITATVPST